METYDVYEIYYHGKMSEYKDVLNEDEFGTNKAFFLIDYISECGDWDLVASYKNKDEAYRMWDRKWENMAETKIDEDDNDFFSATVYRFEKTIRNEDGEPEDSYDIDGSVFLLED